LFLAKVKVAPWFQPGDLLHLGMAIGLVLFASLKPRDAALARA
jgi:hypothetical protein